MPDFNFDSYNFPFEPSSIESFSPAGPSWWADSKQNGSVTTWSQAKATFPETPKDGDYVQMAIGRVYVEGGASSGSYPASTASVYPVKRLTSARHSMVIADVHLPGNLNPLPPYSIYAPEVFPTSLDQCVQWKTDALNKLTAYVNRYNALTQSLNGKVLLYAGPGQGLASAKYRYYSFEEDRVGGEDTETYWKIGLVTFAGQPQWDTMLYQVGYNEILARYAEYVNNVQTEVIDDIVEVVDGVDWPSDNMVSVNASGYAESVAVAMEQLATNWIPFKVPNRDVLRFEDVSDASGAAIASLLATRITWAREIAQSYSGTVPVGYTMTGFRNALANDLFEAIAEGIISTRTDASDILSKLQAAEKEVLDLAVSALDTRLLIEKKLKALRDKTGLVTPGTLILAHPARAAHLGRTFNAIPIQECMFGLEQSGTISTLDNTKVGNVSSKRAMAELSKWIPVASLLLASGYNIAGLSHPLFVQTLIVNAKGVGAGVLVDDSFTINDVLNARAKYGLDENQPISNMSLYKRVVGSWQGVLSAGNIDKVSGGYFVGKLSQLASDDISSVLDRGFSSEDKSGAVNLLKEL